MGAPQPTPTTPLPMPQDCTLQSITAVLSPSLGPPGWLASPAGHREAHLRSGECPMNEAPFLTQRGPQGVAWRLQDRAGSDLSSTTDSTLSTARLHSSPSHRAISTVPTDWPQRVSYRVKTPEVNPNLSRVGCLNPTVPKGWSHHPHTRLGCRAGSHTAPRSRGRGRRWALRMDSLGPRMLSGAPESDAHLTSLLYALWSPARQCSLSVQMDTVGASTGQVRPWVTLRWPWASWPQVQAVQSSRPPGCAALAPHPPNSPPAELSARLSHVRGVLSFPRRLHILHILTQQAQCKQRPPPLWGLNAWVSSGPL